MTWSEKVMMHICRSVSSAWALLWCFHRYSLSLSQIIGENCWWPFMTWKAEMAWETWGGVTGRNIPIHGVNSNCNPLFESASNDFQSMEAPFNFLPLTHNGEVANWPDFGSSMSQNWCRVKCLLRASERSELAKSFQYNGKISVWAARPGPTRPETLFRGSYLSNRWADWPAVFLLGSSIPSTP